MDKYATGAGTGYLQRRMDNSMIHERGYYTDKEDMADHRFDERLCWAIIKLCGEFDIRRVKTIIDIGCGDGSYVKEFRRKGFTCDGFDGCPLTEKIPYCGIKDLSKELVFITAFKYDLAICLEVGEHIPQKYEQFFIDNICITSDNIILSWAIEGQGGLGHVNCRNNDYIIAEMKKRNFDYDAIATNFLRKNSTLPWFKNTLMAFYK
jgi:hypothetical protein